MQSGRTRRWRQPRLEQRVWRTSRARQSVCAAELLKRQTVCAAELRKCGSQRVAIVRMDEKKAGGGQEALAKKYVLLLKIHLKQNVVVVCGCKIGKQQSDM